MTDTATELRDLVTTLAHDHDEPLIRLGQWLTIRQRPPLLDQLRTATTPTISATGRGTALGPRLAFDPAASELYDTIRKRIRAWARNAGVPQHWAQNGTLVDWTDAARLLTAWHARTLHTDPMTWIPTLHGWTVTIRELLDPPRRWTLDAACPECGQRRTEIRNGNQRELVDTIEVTVNDAIDATTSCRNCGATWNGLDGAEHLATLIKELA